MNLESLKFGGRVLAVSVALVSGLVSTADGVEASDGPSLGLRGGYAALTLGPGSF